MLADARLPSLVSIRAFEAAARLGGFAQAASELDTTAASVSYHVRRLEQHLGFALFVRYAQRVSLTPAGATIAAEATRTFAALRASFTRARQVEESRLSITTLPTFGTSWLIPRLGRFRARHADLSVELDLSAEAQELGDGRFDAAIRNGHGQWPGLRTVDLLPSVFMPLCAPALLPAMARLDDPTRALDVPLLGRSDWWQLWYRARGFAQGPDPARFGMRLATEHLDVTAALAGQGVAIASPILFRDEIDAGRLVPAHDAVASDGRRFWLTYPPARQRGRKLTAFREWLCDEASRAHTRGADFIRRAVIVAP